MAETERQMSQELEEQVFQAVLNQEIKPGEFGQFSDIKDIEIFVANALQTIAVCE
jgi:hypothetical protein